MNINREVGITVVFIVAAILATVGFLADDLRVLAYVGTPVAVAALLVSKSRLMIAVSVCAFAALRFLFTLAVTGDWRMLAGLVVSGGVAVLLLRVAADRELEAKSRRSVEAQDVSDTDTGRRRG